MAIKALNSVAGFSVGEVPANIILANGDITSTNGTFTANISAGNVKTDNLLYANGTPWDLQLPGGSNTYVQFNDNGDLGGNANFTFNKATSVLTVTGNIAASNVNAGNVLTANFLTGTLTTAAQPNITSVGNLTSLTVSDGNVSNTIIAYGNGTLAVSGNITANNFVGNISGNISGNIVIPGANTGVVFNDNGNANTSTAFTFNKVSNVVTASGNISAGNLTTGGVVSATGNVTGSNLITAGNVFAPAIVQNASTYDTRISLSSGAGIIEANAGGNATQFLPGGSVRLPSSGASDILGGTFDGSKLTLNNDDAILSQSRGGNVKLQVGAGGTIANTWTFAQNGSFTAPGNITTSANANVGNLNTLGNANIGNLVISGFVAGNLTPNANITYDLGNTTNRWKDLYLSGTSIILGDQTITANAAGISLSNTAYMAALTVSGNANVGNLGTAGLIVATGNIDGGNLNTGGVVAATGNVSGGNFNTTGLVSATGNVTGGNLNTGGVLSVTGNANVGNLGTGGLIVATGNVSGGNINTGGIVAATGNIVSNANVVTDLIVGRTSSITITATGSNQNVNLVPTGTGTVNVGNFLISNVQTPLSDYDAATKKYVDDVAQGLNIHDACAAATPATLATITSGTITYNNGASGVGANLVTTGSFNLIDGVNVQTSGTRILVKNEANAAHNGIYVWSNATVITRAADFNSVPEVEAGDFTFVTGGSTYDNTGWVQTEVVTTIGTSPISFTQFSGAGSYTAGTGLTLTGSVFSIANTTVTAGAYGNGDYNATFTVNQQGQLTAAANVAITANAANLTGTTLSATVVNSSLTSVGTLANLTVTGNATVGNLITSGAGGGNITGANVVSANFFTGTLTTAAQPNITSVGTLTSLTVSGTSNLGAVGNVTITGGSSGYYLQTNGSGTLTWAAIPVGSGISNGTSNVSIPSVNGNVNLTAGGNTTLVVTDTGANIAGTLNVTGNATVGNLTTSGGSGGSISGANLVSANFITGTLTTAAQPNITSVGSLTSLTVTGNANVGNLGTGGLIVATGNVTGGNLTTAGLVSATGNVSGGNITTAGAVAATGNVSGGNLTTAGLVSATGNVTGGNLTTAGAVAATGNVSGGNLSTGGALSVTGTANVGNLNVSGTSNLGPVGNVTITGGSSGQVLSTNGSGGLSFISISSSSISNGNSNVNIPAANGNVNISAVGNANVLVITGTGANVNGTLNVTGNLTAGNFIAGAGTGGNITGANVVSANFFTGTLTTNAQPNITSVGSLTSLTVSGTSNLGPVGNVTITGGSSGYYLQTNGSGTLTWAAIPTSSGISNGTSNVSIPTINGNVNLSAAGNTTLVVTGTGANIAGTLNATGNATVANLAGGNLVSANFLTGTLTTAAQPNITSVGTLTSLAVTGNVTAGNLIGALANGNSNVNIPSSNGNINLTAVGNTTLVVTGTGANIAGTLNVTGNATVGNLTTGGSGGNISGANVISANTLSATSGVQISNSAVYFANLTTTSTGANQTIATIAVSGSYVTGVEYLVKGVDATGTKYSVATVVSVTNGTTADYSTFATVNLGGSTGTLAVNISGSNIALQVTPASSNSTVWTTQYRVI